MKKINRIIFYRVLPAMILLIIAGYGCYFLFMGGENRKNINPKGENLGNPTTQTEEESATREPGVKDGPAGDKFKGKDEKGTAGIEQGDEPESSPVPYGKPVYGSLSWETEAPFREECNKCGVKLRLAAFQIYFPDALPGEKSNVIRAAGLLAGKVVQPAEYFSLNRAIGPYSRERGFVEGPAYSGSYVVSAVGGGVCKVATTLYNAAVAANLQILERHTHSMLVPYVPPGRDATVAYGFKDLSFKNTTEYPLLIWTDTKGTSLTVALYGGAYPPRVIWNHERLGWQKRPTVYHHNPSLKAGEEKIIYPGSDGVTARSWLTILGRDGTTETRDLGVAYYRPMPKVIEKKIW